MSDFKHTIYVFTADGPTLGYLKTFYDIDEAAKGIVEVSQATDGRFLGPGVYDGDTITTSDKTRKLLNKKIKELKRG